MKMTVLYVKGTGHVLAAFTRAAEPAAEPAPAGPQPTAEEIDDAPATAEVTGLVGAALAVRGFPDPAGTMFNLARFAIPAQRLMALTVERAEERLLSPRLYAVLDRKKLAVLPAANGLTLAVAASHPRILKLTLPAAATGPTWVQLHLAPAANGDSQMFSTLFTPTSTNGTAVSFSAPAPLSGTYDALILVQGLLAAALQVTV